MYQRILVPIDGSRTSTAGLKEAIRIAIDQRARLRLIHVVDELVVAQNFEGYINAGELLEALRDAGRKAMQKAQALVSKHDVKAEASIFESLGGRVSEIIVKEAKKWRADLIVMGTHGRRGVTRMVLGSDAEAVLRETPVPVLLVRSPASSRRRHS